jgi:hypothetical protein
MAHPRNCGNSVTSGDWSAEVLVDLGEPCLIAIRSEEAANGLKSRRESAIAPESLLHWLRGRKTGLDRPSVTAASPRQPMLPSKSVSRLITVKERADGPYHDRGI